MGDKLKALIIGPGNIGTDLLMKALRSDHIEPVWMVGIEESEGIKRARDMGLKTSVTGIEGALPSVIEDDVRIAFDATSAYVHAENAKALNALGVIMVDLTPAAIGPFCVPPVNLAQQAEALEMNVNNDTDGSHLKVVDDFDDCAVCQEQMVSARRIPTCGHHFHQFCIIQLIQNGCKNCPICRAEIRFSGGAEPPQDVIPPLGDDRRRAR